MNEGAAVFFSGVTQEVSKMLAEGLKRRPAINDHWWWPFLVEKGKRLGKLCV
jgi:hypothetical protein